ncbi:MAG TPA: DUF3857 domain-containing protein [Terriglobales bacterium]
MLPIFAVLPQAFATGDAPGWMHSLVNVPLPPHDEKAAAVLLYSETNVTVISTDKVKTVVRQAYKILRPEGREYGNVWVDFNPHKKVTVLHGWCIPAQGKDYEVKEKDVVHAARDRRRFLLRRDQHSPRIGRCRHTCPR